MTTSLLYHAFGMTTQKYLRTEFKSGTVVFYTQTKPDKLRCSHCGSKQVIKRGSKIRDFRTVPIGLKPVLIRAMIQRLTCQDCGLTRQEKITFADEKKVTPIVSEGL
jgi:transposase